MAFRRGGASFPEFQNVELIKQLAISENNFTRDLYIALSKESDGNLFFSPFSIMAALSMTHMGTDGNTALQVQKVLHLPQDKTKVKTAFQEIIGDYKKVVEQYELKTSNMMYVSHKLKILDEFSNSLTKFFHSSSKNVDFGESEVVRGEINAIVEKETNSKIKDLIPPGVIDDLTRMVLVNAVYFKGLWQNQFETSATRNEKFYITPDNAVKIPMMHIEDNFRFSPLKDLDANLLAMDYQGGRLSMLIILPNAKDGLADLETKLTTADLTELDKRHASCKVKVTLPRFKLEQTFELPQTLAKMGMTDLFDGTCDLSAITGEKDLFVSAVIHKSFIEVTEEGSEAAAATDMTLMRRSMPRPPRIFVADHPFTFLIVDKASELVLFMGRFIGGEN